MRFHRKKAQIRLYHYLTNLAEVQSKEQVKMRLWSQKIAAGCRKTLSLPKMRNYAYVFLVGVAGFMNSSWRLEVILLLSKITFVGSSTISSPTFWRIFSTKLCNAFTRLIFYRGTFSSLLGFRANTWWFLGIVRIFKFFASITTSLSCVLNKTLSEVETSTQTGSEPTRMTISRPTNISVIFPKEFHNNWSYFARSQGVKGFYMVPNNVNSEMISGRPRAVVSPSSVPTSIESNVTHCFLEYLSKSKTLFDRIFAVLTESIQASGSSWIFLRGSSIVVCWFSITIISWASISQSVSTEVLSLSHFICKSWMLVDVFGSPSKNLASKDTQRTDTIHYTT